MNTPTLNTQYVTNGGGLACSIVEAIDALLPILPGDPEGYIDADGRPDMELILKGQRPHTHSTEPAARLIRDLWTLNKSNPLVSLFGHADSGNRARLGKALRALTPEADA